MNKTIIYSVACACILVCGRAIWDYTTAQPTTTQVRAATTITPTPTPTGEADVFVPSTAPTGVCGGSQGGCGCGS